jgi:hypothetical protein
MERNTKDLLTVAVLALAAVGLAVVLGVLLAGCDEGGGGGDADECDQDDCDIECPPDTCQDEYNLIRYDRECYGWDYDGSPICGCSEDVKHCDHSPCYQGEPDYCSDF